MRGENSLKVQQLKNDYLKEQLQTRRPYTIGQETPEHLAQEMQDDPDLMVYGPQGKLMTPTDVLNTPQGMMYGKYQRGSTMFFSTFDPKNKTINVDGQIVQVDPYGPIAPVGSGASPVVGQATSTLPKASSTTDPFGLTTTSTTQNNRASGCCPNRPSLQRSPASSKFNISRACCPPRSRQREHRCCQRSQSQAQQGEASFLRRAVSPNRLPPSPRRQRPHPCWSRQRPRAPVRQQHPRWNGYQGHSESQGAGRSGGDGR